MGAPLPETYRGTVKRIIFRNQSNGYTVALVLCAGDIEITAVGNMFDIEVGEEIEIIGTFGQHRNYGEQFNVASYQKLIPTTAASILKYLSAGTVSGIGPATAKKIVLKFGDKSLDVMENHPQRLAAIKGITIERAMQISQEMKEHKSLRNMSLELCSMGFSQTASMDIIRKLGAGCVDIVKENPYFLCGEGLDFNFEMIDEIARNINPNEDFAERLGYGMQYVLKHNLLNGHTCLPREKLIEVSAQMLETDTARLNDACDDFIFKGILCEFSIDERLFISLRRYFDAERQISGRLNLINTCCQKVKPINSSEIEFIENEIGVELDEIQRDAVIKSAHFGSLVLTGGPGTGKTTTLKAIIKAMQRRNLKILLAAPTGRAAKRMAELTGMEAKTIHRLLEVEWSEGEDKHVFARCAKNPLNCDLLIVDEFSMVDTLLFDSLLDAVSLGCRIILVGDPDQLPSVGAGNILEDIIASGALNCVSLQRVFRQAGESLIVSNAHLIVKGKNPTLDCKDGDFFMLKANSTDRVLSLVRELYTERLPAAYGFESLSDIQVLCPSRLMGAGSAGVNAMLQQAVNPPAEGKREIAFKGGCLREGDKVMQIKNNYDIIWHDTGGESGTGVFNGDMGVLEKINLPESSVFIRYDDRIAEYPFEELSQIELAYAVTVHKSQGSEFECVIIPLVDTPPKLKYRNLLYTAVTRAKKLLIIVGRDSNVYAMVENNKKTLRYTLLKAMLEQ